MNKENQELELLKRQNELLREQLETKNNKNNNLGLIIIIIILLAIIIIGGIIFFNWNENSNDNYNNQQNNTSTTTTKKEKTCIKWKNTYNFKWCEYNFTDGCNKTGQECVEWR